MKEARKTQRKKEENEMTPEERTRLESIDAVLQSEAVREQIRPIIERVRAELARTERNAIRTVING